MENNKCITSFLNLRFLVLSIVTVILIGLTSQKYKIIWSKLIKLSNTTEVFLGLISPLVTIGVAILVYKYTTDNNRRQLLNSLDEKSGWRKSLFDLAGKNIITYNDIHKLRATLRFNNHKENDTYFKYMSNIMIDYCDKAMKCKYQNFEITFSESIFLDSSFIPKISIESNEEKEKRINTKFDSEIIRIFSRYLLANHWEKNQLTEKENKKIENFQKIIFNKNIIWVTLYRQFILNKKLIKINDKELELLEHTLNKFINISK